MKYRELSLKNRHLRLGDLQIDLEAQQVWREGHRIELPDLSFRLLEVLLDQPGRIVSHGALQRQVWGDIVVSDDALRQRVRLLRKALGSDKYVATVKGVGYRLAQPAISGPPRWRRPWRIAAAAMLAVASLILLGAVLIPGVTHTILHALRH